MKECNPGSEVGGGVRVVDQFRIAFVVHTVRDRDPVRVDKFLGPVVLVMLFPVLDSVSFQFGSLVSGAEVALRRGSKVGVWGEVENILCLSRVGRKGVLSARFNHAASLPRPPISWRFV